VKIDFSQQKFRKTVNKQSFGMRKEITITLSRAVFLKSSSAKLFFKIFVANNPYIKWYIKTIEKLFKVGFPR